METTVLFRDYLNRKKMFFTRERREIACAVEDLPSGFDADALHDRLRVRGLAMAHSTVYRNLRLLCAAGAVEPEPRLNGRSTFRKTGLDTPRYSVFCRDCNAEQEIRDPELEEAVADFCRRRGLAVDGLKVRIETRRRCRECRCARREENSAGRESDTPREAFRPDPNNHHQCLVK